MQGIHDSALQALHTRVLTLFLACSVAYLWLATRFTWLQALHHTHPVVNRDLKAAVIPARRGDILDRNGIPLAVSVDGYDLGVRPNLIRALKASTQVSGRLSETLGMPRDEILSKLSQPHPFGFIRRRVSRATGQAVLALGLPGVTADAVFLRTYPQGSLAAQVVGRVNTDDRGKAGVEEGFERLLHGHDGLKRFRVDGKGQPIPGTETIVRPVLHGQEIRLTLDSRIQEVAEEQLDKAVQDHHAAAGCTIVIDVPTGQILAMANRPTFNPNLPVKEMAPLLNRVISYAYEPGSTMKMVTAAGALAEHAWTDEDHVTCSGSIMIGRRRIRCVIEPPYHGGHGYEHLRDIIRNSCNIGAATVGMKLGGDKLYEYIQRFGLLQRSPIGLPGAVAYRLSKPDTWARVRLANIAFGQGVMVTPIQLAYAYASVANGGRLMQPDLVEETIDPNTGIVRRAEPQVCRQVIPADIAAKVTGLLKAVIYDGTGKPSQLSGYLVAGKTGSAQKAGAHGYLAGKYVASFVGFAPASHPRIACLTMIDEPQGVHWGAVCAAPVVREILRWSLEYLQVPPDAPQLRADGASRPSYLRQEKEVEEGVIENPEQIGISTVNRLNPAAGLTAAGPSRKSARERPRSKSFHPHTIARRRRRALLHELDGGEVPPKGTTSASLETRDRESSDVRSHHGKSLRGASGDAASV